MRRGSNERAGPPRNKPLARPPNWRNARNADGRFEIEFLGEDGSPLWVERGYWAISGCLYASLITEVDGEPVLYQEVYRVHEISRDHLVYSNYRTGNTFEQHRVGSGED